MDIFSPNLTHFSELRHPHPVAFIHFRIKSELAEVPALVSAAVAKDQTVSLSPAVAEKNAKETARAQKENALVGAGKGGRGKLGDGGLC